VSPFKILVLIYLQFDGYTTCASFMRTFPVGVTEAQVDAALRETVDSIYTATPEWELTPPKDVFITWAPKLEVAA
jgi:hypothetical protein